MAQDAFGTVFYTIGFLVPGFIWHSTLAALVPERETPVKLAFLRFLALSCINYGLWSWLIYFIFHVPFFTGHPVRTAIAWFLIVFVSPVVLGMLLACLRHKDIVRRVLQRAGFTPIHGIPTSWDYVFGKVVTARVWVVVKLKTGEQVVGLFGGKSFASSESVERDLFIEEVLETPKKGPLKRKPRSLGMLISRGEIRSIEFLKLTWENQHAGKDPEKTD